jgi:hypothetical protein
MAGHKTDPVESRVFSIRGEKVMLDRDLAVLYGVTAEELNRAVRRNARRFPEDFMFRMTPQERDSLERGRHPKYGSRAFTGPGVVMLSAVLDSGLAIQVSIAVVRMVCGKCREEVFAGLPLEVEVVFRVFQSLILPLAGRPR